MEKINPYEQLQNMPDGILRPGGFELTERLIELGALVPGSRILDAGCGTGGSVRYLTEMGFDVVGVDVSVELTSQYTEAKLITAKAEDLPFEDNSFDAVLYECSLSLMDATAALREAGRVLRHEGRILISDVFAGTSGRFVSGMCVRTAEEFLKLLNDCGFEIIHFEDKTIVFESFVAQLIMSQGSVEALFSCGEWAEIKKARPRYCLASVGRILL